MGLDAINSGRTNVLTSPVTLTADLTLANGEKIDNDTDGTVYLQGAGGTNNEDLGIDLETTANAAALISTTSVTTLDLAAVGTTVKLANDQTIVSDTNNEIQLGDGTEDVSFGFGTSNEVTVTTDTGVTRVDFEDIGVKTSVPLFLLAEQHFCGQGANGTTPTYIGPVLQSLADDMRTYVYGAAGCDGLDNTTEATADAPLDRIQALEVHGMVCSVTGGTDDVYTFQLRDDTADVTGVTCNVTLDGGLQTCQVILDAPVTVATASALAVKQVAATDDNCSACDTECFVYFSF